MLRIMSNTQIPCRNVLHCPVCKSTGSVIYTGLTDFLSNTPGTWGMRSCENKMCNTIWLDPAPLSEYVHLLYSDYHTHNDPPAPVLQNRKGLRRLLDQMSESVLTEDLNYPSSLPSWKIRLLNMTTKIHPGWRDEKKNQVLYVPYISEGSLLDVGCGAGDAMQILQNKGWKVTGTDFDEGAVKNARSKGLEVHLGDLKDMHFEEDSFDAILCCNVIEHTVEPKALLQECLRILKPGGRLTMITNSSVSRGHKRFKNHWRGLEIPRHLQIFTPASLENLAKQAGFQEAVGGNCLQGIYYMWDASEAHEKSGTFELPPTTSLSQFKTRIKSFTSGVRLAFFPGAEESILLYAVKK